MSENLNLRSALFYANKYGFAVLPVAKGEKSPCIKWTEYQTRKPTESEIREWWGKWPDHGMAVVTGKVSNLAVWDIDYYKSETALQILQGLTPPDAKYPICKTPRGGQHWYFKWQEGLANIEPINGLELHVDGKLIMLPPSVNGKGKKYEWDSKASIKNIALPSLPNKHILYINNNIRESTLYREKVTEVTGNHQNNISFNEGYRDQTLFHLANHLIKSYMPIEEVQQYLEFIASHCTPPFPQKDLEIKILSALKREEGRTKHITADIREYIEVTAGNIKVTDGYQLVTAVTKAEKKAVQMAFSRLASKGLLKKTGRYAGEYRIIDQNRTEIDFKNVTQRQLNIQYPLGEEEFVWTMPKSIVVLAGSPDAGKTAWMLNFVRLNMHDYKIKYFSSEMGAMELQSRLILAKDIEINQWKFSAEERTENFVDVIDPNGVNVIDFLEIGTNFFEIGTLLTELHAKLKTGICVVAIQKDPKAEVGRGASFSLEKPRLYMTIDSDFPGAILRIKKAKNWRNSERNPNSMERRFKIVKGINLIPDGSWDLP